MGINQEPCWERGRLARRALAYCWERATAMGINQEPCWERGCLARRALSIR